MEFNEGSEIQEEFQNKLLFLSECKLEEYDEGVSIIVNSRFVYMNRKCKEIFGVEEVYEKFYSMYDFVSSQDANRFHRLRKKVLREKELPNSFSFWIVNNLNERLYITNYYIQINPSRNPLDRIIVTKVHSAVKPLNQSLHEIELKCSSLLEKLSNVDSI